MSWENRVDDMVGPAGAEEGEGEGADETDDATSPEDDTAAEEGHDGVDEQGAEALRRPRAPRSPGPTRAEEAVAAALREPGGFGALGLGSALYPADRFRDAEPIGYKALADVIERTERTLRARDKTYPALMIHTWWAEASGGERTYVDTHEDFLDQRHRAGSYHVRIKASPEPDQEHPGDLYYTCDVAAAAPDGREGGPLGVNLALLRTTEELKAENTELRDLLRQADKKNRKVRGRLKDVEDDLHEALRDKRDLEDEVQRLKDAEAGAPWIDDELAEQGMMSAVQVMQSWAQNPGGRPQERLEQIWNTVYRFFASLGDTPVLGWLAEHRAKNWDKLVSTLNQIATEEQAPAEMRFLTSAAIMQRVRAARARGLPSAPPHDAAPEARARRGDPARDERPHEGHGRDRSPRGAPPGRPPEAGGGGRREESRRPSSPWRRDPPDRGRPHHGDARRR